MNTLRKGYGVDLNQEAGTPGNRALLVQKGSRRPAKVPALFETSGLFLPRRGVDRIQE